MTLYNVHIYREMRLYFPGIEANTPEDAARIAADKPTADAAYTEDCDGETLAALIDVVGDDEFGQSVSLDFENERLRKAAPNLLTTLAALLTAADDLDAAIDGTTDQFDDERAVLEKASCLARAAIATATAGKGADASEFNVHELLAVRGQIALIWSIQDVQEARPDLTGEQAWDVLKRVQDKHDATIGVTWETLEWAARDLFGDAPETDEA